MKETYKIYKHTKCSRNYEWLGRLGRIPKQCPGCKKQLKEGEVIIFNLMKVRNGD